jgi:SAM-dependent methyltransferase
MRGGYLLKNLDCGRKLGIEIDPQAAEAARKNGVEVFGRTDDLPDCSVDVVISNNALEHTLSPLEELKALHGKLRTGGKLIFVVPCESIRRRFRPGDRNHHLYSWSPMCIGNLLAEAGFHVLESRPYIHKWPPGYRLWARIFGMRMFDVICRVYGRLERSWFQVRAVGEKRAGASR